MTPTCNIYQIIFGDDRIKWDSLWRGFYWLCDKDEGHGLGKGFIDKLWQYSFGQDIDSYEMKLEFRTDSDPSRGGNWVDFAIAEPDFENPKRLFLMDDVDKSRGTSSRKVEKLTSYFNDAKELIGKGQARLILLTNGTHELTFPKLAAEIGDKSSEQSGNVSWNILPLLEVGKWAEELVDGADFEAKRFIKDLSEWAKCFE